MSYKYRAMVSWGCGDRPGVPVDVLKSGLQKYARRRCVDKMLFCCWKLHEMHARTGESADPRAGSVGKGVRTNMVNRLRIVLEEDVLFAEVYVHNTAHDLLETYLGGGDFENVSKVCVLICGARLLRLNSDVNCFFRAYAAPAPGDPVAHALRCVDGRDPMAYGHALQLLAASDAPRAQRKNTPVYRFFRGLLEIAAAEPPAVTRAAHIRFGEFDRGERLERKFFLLGAVSLLMHAHLANDASPGTLETWTPRPPPLWVDIDSFVVDMHTSAGRRAGMDGRDFGEDGAFILDEDTQFLNPEWRAFYRHCKGLPAYTKKVRRE